MLFPANSERGFAEAISRLSEANPFLPERIECERDALGDEFVAEDAVWSFRADVIHERANIARLKDRAELLAETLRKRLVEGGRPSDQELILYEDLVLWVLYHRYREHFEGTIARGAEGNGPKQARVGYYRKFLNDTKHFFVLPELQQAERNDPAHLFAGFFQIRRAFHLIFTHIIGGSMPAARLRAVVWQSIFTHDFRRYRRALYKRMGDFTTLITGPSGTGKELVARAIGLSRYIPFDSATETFSEDFAGAIHAVNLSALSPTLIESELFGHHRGAFTGAVADRVGWLEVCKPSDAVFLDEIGDLDPAIQVKLLRVLQSRTFQRLGETKDRKFHGKLIAATNRDLAAEMRAGRFREDFYYRLCSDQITTPSLHEQLSESPSELQNLVLFIAQRMVGSEAEGLTEEVVAWINRSLGDAYRWPGNIRELEQCVRNVLVRKEYRPAAFRPKLPRDALVDAVRAGNLTADQLLQRYCSMVYAETGNYEETARRLQLDRRTVKRKIDPRLLEQFRGNID